MFLGQVIGTVVATVKTPAHAGHRILLVQPYTFERQPDGATFAAIDLVSAGRGEWVYYVKGREAANALPDRPAMMIAVSRTAISRSIETPSKLTVKISAPKRRSWSAP